MIVMASRDRLELSEAETVDIHVAGAEANVATGLAMLGSSVEWWSRLGADPFGDRIRRVLTDRGVRCDGIVADATRPTGVYFKDTSSSRTEVFYYRRGSAASEMSPADLPLLHLSERSLVHVSGITAALSERCDDLLTQILSRRSASLRISFDVNFRRKLWGDVETAAVRLRGLANASDIVFVGRDEAESLWGCPDVAAIRETLPGPAVLVVKDADHEATAIRESRSGEDHATVVPALRVDTVDAVGAGDAFASGWLSGWLAGDDDARALRKGHLMAAHALIASADVNAHVDATLIEELSGVDDDRWRELRFPLAPEQEEK